MIGSDSAATMTARLPRHIVVLGVISFLTAMSSAMVYGLLPLFLVQVLHSSMTSVGLIEGIAEGASSLMKIASGAATDWLGRRKPIVLFGYLVSAVNKLLFPLAESVTMVLAARVIDRLGKGVRDAPRDAFLADVTPAPVRGSGFGLRLAFYTAGFVVGPVAAMTIMRFSQHDFRLVFWLAVIPAAAAIAVLLVALREPPRTWWTAETVPLKYLRGNLASLPRAFWWAVAIASLLSMARFSQAFLVLKAFDVGMDPAFVPTTLVVMHLAYACAAYPFGILADRVDRRALLGIGVAVLTCADIVLASASTIPAVLVGAALWGLQLAVTQGLLSATVADAAPRHLRGTAFGLYELAVGLAAFVASAAAGTFWTIGGPALSFGVSTLVASFAGVVLLFRPMPISNGSTGAG
jgi:MFS family permease